MFAPSGYFLHRRANSFYKRVSLIVLLWVLGWIVAGIWTAIASHVTITFEEPIPVPGNVRTQYCNNPATSRGVEFKFAAKIFEPPVATASGTHAIMAIPDSDDVNPFAGPMVISFTTGQTHVGMMVGLDRSYEFPVSAVLRAYDDPDPGEGTKLTPTPDPSVVVGTGPIAITTPLAFSTPGDAPTIRRIEIEFLGPAGESALEVLDDLTFGEVGPLCITDTQPPSVQILRPLAGQSITSPQVLLHFRVQDLGSGVASIRVVMLGSGGTELSPFFYCGGNDFPRTCPGFPSSFDVDAQFFTFFPRGTLAIRVEAVDFAGNTGQAQVSINLALPDPNYNLWALGIELTQGIQHQAPSSTRSRSPIAPQETLETATIPLIAGKRTVVRVYPGVEATTIPVIGARATLRCCNNLPATLGDCEPCGGPASVDAVIPEITVNPAR
jgi:hypothetical protein